MLVVCCAEQLIQGFNNDPARPKTAGIAFQTSDAWVSMYTDITAISGTGFSIVAMARVPTASELPASACTPIGTDSRTVL